MNLRIYNLRKHTQNYAFLIRPGDKYVYRLDKSVVVCNKKLTARLFTETDLTARLPLHS